MDRLSLFNGVRSGLSRSEFTELLGVFPIDSLRSLRAGLFNDACFNVNNLSCEEIIRGLEGADADIIFSIATSKLNSVLTASS